MTRRIIKVAGMTGMNRKQVKLTNGVANCLVRKHSMCLDCAIKFSVGFVWGQDRPEHNPMQIGPLCSAACSDALVEFFEETLGSKGEEVTDPDELARLNGYRWGKVFRKKAHRPTRRKRAIITGE